MQSIHKYSFLFLFLICAMPVSAVNVYECIDSEGNTVFQDRCPPGMTKKSEMKYNGKAPTEENKFSKFDEQPVIIYLTPNCTGCEQMLDYFNAREISVVEKNIEDNIELQNELIEKIGNLSVPTVDIHGEYLSGYNDTKLTEILNSIM